MMRHTILLVEDADDILAFNKKRLEQEGYRVLAAQSLHQARELLEVSFPDLAVLDIVLPDGTGVDLCRQLAASAKIPILFLTSLNDSEQVIAGLRAGGDDYITKPYKSEELLARIEAQLRRMEQLRTTDDDVNAVNSRLRVDAVNHRVYWSGADLLLNPKEYRLFLTLLKSKNRYLSAEELYARVWGLNAATDIRTVEVHISRLRAKLRGNQEPPAMAIEHARGRGYRILFSCRQ